jgi:parallel beta-helix repeat protein
MQVTNFTITGGTRGVSLESCSNTRIAENNIVGNHVGLVVDSQSTSTLISLNVFNNTINAFDYGTNNAWDNGYRGGNWWSDYRGIDQFRGPDQDELWPDGIGEKPYIIPHGANDWGSRDNYPWMYPKDVRVVNIDTGETFQTIQAAIDDNDTLSLSWWTPFQPVVDPLDPDLLPGHTIFVLSGTYHENIRITKSLNVIGVNKETTIIDGDGSDDVVQISADHVTFLGFTVKNSSRDFQYWYRDNAGIDIRSKRNTISGNIITTNDKGLFLRSSDNNISQNEISRNSYGIFLERDSCYNTISENAISRNEYGIFLWYDVSYRHLPIIQFSCGYNIIANNTVTKNSCGIYLEDVDFNNVYGNTVDNNYEGIWIEWYWDWGHHAYRSYPRENSVYENTITHNTYGAIIEGIENRIYHNNFIFNYGPAEEGGEFSSTIWDDSYPSGGNYWAYNTFFNYNGTDSCHGPDQNLSGVDGIGDTPYEVYHHYPSPYGNKDRYPVITQDGWRNNPPATPCVPSGVHRGVVGKIYSFITSTTDPEGYPLYYNFSWGDRTYSGWVGPYASGALANASHAWTSPGNYHVQVKAKDTRGSESPWSPELVVHITRGGLAAEAVTP